MLKMNINVLKRRKRNTKVRLIGAQKVPEDRSFAKFSEFPENQKKKQSFRNIERMKERKNYGGTLRVLRAETWLTVCRTIAIRKQ